MPHAKAFGNKHSSKNHLVDEAVMWKMHGRLSGTGRLYGSRQYTQVGMIPLDNL